MVLHIESFLTPRDAARLETHIALPTSMSAPPRFGRDSTGNSAQGVCYFLFGGGNYALAADS
jgi:hypothetical protein